MKKKTIMGTPVPEHVMKGLYDGSKSFFEGADKLANVISAGNPVFTDSTTITLIVTESQTRTNLIFSTAETEDDVKFIAKTVEKSPFLNLIILKNEIEEEDNG